MFPLRPHIHHVVLRMDPVSVVVECHVAGRSVLQLLLADKVEEVVACHPDGARVVAVGGRGVDLFGCIHVADG